MNRISLHYLHKKIFSSKKNILTIAASFGAIISVLIIGVKDVGALGTPAGTPIGNAATATYKDADNNEFRADTPIVQTIVQEVCGVDVASETTDYEAVDGQTIDIPIDIINIGNGENTFTIAENSVQFTTNIYLDSNRNGVADPAEVADGEITDITIGLDATGKIVVQVTANAANAGNETVTITVTGTLPAGCDDTIDVTTTVINDALIDGNKSVNTANAAGGDTLTFSIPFINNGTLAAKSTTPINVNSVNSDGILVRDQIPAGTEFAAGSASGAPIVGAGGVVYSIDGGTNWTTAEPGTPADITHVGLFIPDANPTDGVSEAVLASAQSGTLDFQVVIDNPFTQTNLKVLNVAEILYRLDDGATERVKTTNETETTIPADDTADIAAGGLDENPTSNVLTWTNAGGGAPWVNGGDAIPDAEEDVEADGADADDPDSYKDDNYASNVSAGETIEFLHRVQNNSVVDDVVNVDVVSTANLPTGSIVEFFDATGNTALINTNPGDDGLLDVGTVDGGGGTKDLVVKIFIPSNAAAVDLDGTVDHFVDIRFTSVNNPAETDLSRNNIDGIIGSGADIGAPDTVAGVDGVNNDQSDGDTDGTNDSDDVTNVVQTTSVSPGDSIDYPLHFANTGASSDSFSLNASNLPPGASASFFTDPNCDGDPADGTAITETGLVGGTVTTAGSTNTVLNVQNIANFSAGDLVIVSGEQAVVDTVDGGANTITLTAALTGGAPAAGIQVAEYICLVMTVLVDADADPIDGNIVVTAASTVGSVSDNIDVDIVISQTCNVTVTPPLSGQVPPGGTTLYNHTVVNGGNFTGFARIDLVVPSPPQILTYLFIAVGTDTWFIDGGDNTIEGGGVGDDTFIADGGTGVLGSVYVTLAPGASANFTIQVQAANNIPLETTENVNFRAVMDADGDFTDATDQCEGSVSDSTRVIEGFLNLSKEASVADTGTFNTLDGTCTFGTIAVPVADTIVGGPCDQITYTITYLNNGTQNAVDVVVTDLIPNNTTYVTDSAIFDASCDGGADEKPNAADSVAFDGSTVTWTLTDPVIPGEERCLIFDVTIDGAP